MSVPPRILTAGDSALVVEYGRTIDPGVNARVRGLDAALGAAGTRGIIETLPTYRSLIVHYDPLVVSHAALERILLDADARLDDGVRSGSRTIELPVAYGGRFGPDLGDVAAHAGITERDVVAIHSSGEYLVFMLGFMPGFPYLGGMSPRIATPRLATPRTTVPAGSVGIAGAQTGVYPSASPGGWRLIGRTPVRLFDASASPPVLVEAGDLVRFVPIGPGAFDEITRDVVAGRYTPAVRAGR
jgi:KipI family sensor histidine kinase inhibitor